MKELQRTERMVDLDSIPPFFRKSVRTCRNFRRILFNVHFNFRGFAHFKICICILENFHPTVFVIYRTDRQQNFHILTLSYTHTRCLLLNNPDPCPRAESILLMTPTRRGAAQSKSAKTTLAEIV